MLFFLFEDGDLYMFIEPKEDRRRTERRYRDRRLLRCEREFEAAIRITSALHEHLALDELVVKALQIAIEVVNGECGSILLADHTSEQLIFHHSIGTSSVPSGTGIPWDKGLAGTVFQSGDPIVIADAQKDPRHLESIDKLTGYRTRDLITLPLKRWEGDPIGVLQVMNKREGILNGDDLAILTIISAITASSIERARLYQEARLAEVVRLLGDIGHDIKNLLMPVVCGAELIQDDLHDLVSDALKRGDQRANERFDRCEEVVRMVNNSSRRIQDRVKEIADCVKGLVAPPEFAPCRLERIVKEVMETLNWWADQQGVTIQTSTLDQLPEIVADERRLFNALYNLINNAIPEVPRGGQIKIAAKEEPVGVSIHITVADTGKGMPPEIRDTLFTSAAKSRKRGGTGLGTKIVKDVVDAHNGKISVESQLGAGTIFHIYLPLRPLTSLLS
jgi:signal transduction histidine kinase